MARLPRIKIDGHIAGYHIVTRVRGKGFLLDAEMKGYFIRLMRRLKRLFYVNYGAFCVLDNHYHLLVRFKDVEDIDADEAMRRWNDYHAGTEFVRDPGVEESRRYVMRELTDVSAFMKRFNYHLTTHFNSEKEDRGTLWQRRFRSSLIERGWAFINCAAYIELNAFRASLVRKPEEYGFCSLNYLGQGNPDRLLNLDLLVEGLQLAGNPGIRELMDVYTAFVYECGSRPHKDRPDGLIVTEAMRRNLARQGLKPDRGALAIRVVEYIQGKVNSGLELAQSVYETHINPGLSGHARRSHAGKWVRGIGSHLWSVWSGLDP